MDKKRSIINIFNGSVLGAAVTTLWVGFADRGEINQGLAYFGIVALIVISSIFIQKYIRNVFPFLVFLSTSVISFLAIYFSFGFQTRESKRFFILALGTLILFILNLVIFLVRSTLLKKTEEVDKQPVPKTILLFSAVLAVIVFVVPIIFSVYLSSYMPPLVRPGGSVKYDQTWQREGESRKGLLLSFWANGRGKVDDFHWVTSAYLVSREWKKNPDEPWKSGAYVRRAKFYNNRVESFDRNNIGDFEGDRYNSEFFLPYSVLEEGQVQGDFPNYRPEPIGSIALSSDRVQFAVETITVVSKSKDKFPREGVYGKIRRNIFPLDEYAGHSLREENYPTSRWLAMVSRGQRHDVTPSSTPVTSPELPRDRPAVPLGVQTDFRDFLQQVRTEYFDKLRADGIVITDEQRLKIMGHALSLQAQKFDSEAAGQEKFQKLRSEVKSFVEGISSDLSLWSLVEQAEQGNFTGEINQLLAGSHNPDTPQPDAQPATIPSLNATVTALNFFEGGNDGVPSGQRIYRTRFSKSEARFIFWELNLEYPAPGRRRDFDIGATWYKPDGSVLTNQTKPAYLESNWTNSYHSYGWGWEEPGNWQPGSYRVELSVQGQRVASGVFEIY
jgi:hypothetical protein